MNQPEEAQKTSTEGVTHQKTETIIADYGQMLVAAMPIAGELLAHGKAAIETMKATEAEKTRVQETEITRRIRINNITLGFIVALFAGLAALALLNGSAEIAEKIVIGLLAFLAGMNSRR